MKYDYSNKFEIILNIKHRFYKNSLMIFFVKLEEQQPATSLHFYLNFFTLQNVNENISKV